MFAVLFWDHGPRVFWTVLVAALPLVFVIGGFHLWRRICPLAAFSQLPLRFGRGGTKKIEGSLVANAMLLQLGLMAVAMAARLLGANGHAGVLGTLLVALPVIAIGVGTVFRGKTWCNYLCPVGLVETVYTEPSRLIPGGNSQCSTCSACKPHCPDIDPEQSYWKGARARARRIAYFAWPGLVFAFYAYFALEGGSWDAYYSGRWAYESPGLMEAGFSFAPAVPRLLAAPLTLVLGGAASFGLFALGERLAGDSERVRHRALALAGFVAFNAFYYFAGQPTLLQAPVWAQRSVGAAVLIASTLIFVRRWVRTEDDHVRDRFARRLKKRQLYDDVDADITNVELVTIDRERKRARQRQLDAYSDTLRELATEGVVTRERLSVLASVRAQQGITDAEHDRIVARLESAERDLFDPDRIHSAEASLQERQYRDELVRLVQSGVDLAAVESLRQAFGVDEATHERLFGGLVDPEGALAGRVQAAAERMLWLAALADGAGDGAEAEFLAACCRVTLKREGEALERLLKSAGDPRVDRVRELGLGAAAEVFGAEASEASIEVAMTDPDPWVAAAARATGRVRGQGTGLPEPPELQRMLRLRAMDLLRPLDPPDLERVARRVEQRTLRTGDLLCTQGQPGDEVFLVLDGELVVVRDGLEVNRCGSGAVIGELAVLSPAPRSATVMADGDATVLALSGVAFRDLLRSQPHVSEGVLAQLARRLQDQG